MISGFSISRKNSRQGVWDEYPGVKLRLAELSEDPGMGGFWIPRFEILTL
jgi:hypothetical protein